MNYLNYSKYGVEMQELIDSKKVQERLIKLMRQLPRSANFYAREIGIAPVTLKKVIVKGVGDFRTLQLISNYIDKKLGVEIEED